MRQGPRRQVSQDHQEFLRRQFSPHPRIGCDARNSRHRCALNFNEASENGGCRFQYSLAKISAIHALDLRSRDNFSGKSVTIAFSLRRRPADVDTNCYCRSWFGHELLKYICCEASPTLSIRILRISSLIRPLPCGPQAESSDPSMKLLARK